MKIENVKEVFELCRQANGMEVIRITDLAKELGVKKTVLMKYINENSKLFNTYYSSKAKKESDKVLLIVDVYLTPEENPETEEWLTIKILDNLEYIYICAWDNYGIIEGYYVEEDTDEHRTEKMWRNTHSKIEFLKKEGILTEGIFFEGGYADYIKHELDTIITEEGLLKLEQLGWTHNNLPPLTK